MTESLISLLQESPTRSSPLRKQSESPLPVDLDSRLQLLRIDNDIIERQPILSDEVKSIMAQVLSERKNASSLFRLGLQPTKSLLFTGPPGVGKTMAAKWLASQLGRPLLVLDLAAVMSSFLGRTGNNIRFVLDYAKNTECVLLLDELDSIAKRRDDNSEIGELKRLVTVLLQEIDDWPASGILLAATNHPDLLDPAVWRRFDITIKFQNPTSLQIEHFIRELIELHISDYELWSKILSYALNGQSYSDIEKKILHARKSSILTDKPLQEALQDLISSDNLRHEQKIELAILLINTGNISQRRAQEITGLSRDTIRKYKKNILEPSNQ